MEVLKIEEVALRLKRKAPGTIYAIMKRDPSFPRPFKMGSNSYWLASDVEAWLGVQFRMVQEENQARLEQSKGPQAKK